jgi:catechol 2,3-dioxygenase-like lactoylglutathione lyase family enzyme
MSDIVQSTFVLAVRDLDAATAFYVSKLGFQQELAVPGWTFLSRGAAHLRLGHCPDAMPMSEARDHSWFAYLHITDARAFYETVVSNGVEIWHRMRDTPWMTREFGVISPDGHRIVFGQRLTADDATTPSLADLHRMHR